MLKLTSTPGGGITLTFAYYRGSDYFWGFKNLNFAIFLVVEVLSTIFMGMPIGAGIFGGMSFSTGIFWGVSLKMFILWCCLYIKYINLLVYA